MANPLCTERGVQCLPPRSCLLCCLLRLPHFHRACEDARHEKPDGMSRKAFLEALGRRAYRPGVTDAGVAAYGRISVFCQRSQQGRPVSQDGNRHGRCVGRLLEIPLPGPCASGPLDARHRLRRTPKTGRSLTALKNVHEIPGTGCGRSVPTARQGQRGVSRPDTGSAMG